MYITYCKAPLPKQNENKRLGSKKCSHIKDTIMWGPGKLPTQSVLETMGQTHRGHVTIQAEIGLTHLSAKELRGTSRTS